VGRVGRDCERVTPVELGLGSERIAHSTVPSELFLLSDVSKVPRASIHNI
jgi:hypothetical protein